MKRRAYIAASGAGTIALAGALVGFSRPSLRAAFHGPRGVDLTIDRDRDGNSPLEVSGTLVDDEVTVSSPARLRLAVRNRGDRDVDYGTGVPPPLGVLAAGGATLWTDAYVESEHVDGSRLLRTVTSVDDVGLVQPVRAGETVDETYAFAASPGEYRVSRHGNPFELDGVGYAVTLRVFEK
ncbi:hypothetical protein ACFOZ7_21710 [Natribaculum luteum]|uniref:DUF8130 domain-containing protein n=1 Tax=Natribaculum luteum TaxID=1586232 RepID=A0ABD5P5U1_9EURY|nr:hypothetical protein [Natribaculum luteum]